MKTTRIDENYKNEILKMHGFIKEQTTGSGPVENQPKTETNKNEEPSVTDDVKLLRAIEAGCLPGPKTKIKKGSKSGRFVYVDTSKSGKAIYFYADGTWVLQDKSKSGNWQCDQMNQQTPEQQKQTNSQKYFDSWKAYYSKQPQYAGAEIVSELEATPVQKATWLQVSIPNSAKDMGTEKFLYISSKKKEETPKDGDQKTEPQTRRDIQQKADYSKDECEKIIEQWYQNYSTKPDDFDKAYFDAERPKAMYCKRRFYKKWGVDFNSGRLNKIIEFMSRQRDEFEGRTSPSLRSLWKLD